MRGATRILIVGTSGFSHIGASFLRAAAKLEINARLCDTKVAWRHGTLRQRLFWHFRGRRPLQFESFNRTMLKSCEEFQPTVLISTGGAPLSANSLKICRNRGIQCINFSTDDPFNRRHHSAWFLKSLREYDIVFSPRYANLEQLSLHGCKKVHYLQFGYDADLFFADEDSESEESSDLFFAGTAESSRVEYIKAAVRADINVRLYGNYWERYRETRPLALGVAEIPTLRKEIAACRVALCLVRHENRDGHSMRTFELPAVGACMIVEDTVEHRQIFGSDYECVVFFRSPAEMVGKAHDLLRDGESRCRLRTAAHFRIIEGKNTYEDRLRTILAVSTR